MSFLRRRSLLMGCAGIAGLGVVGGAGSIALCSSRYGELAAVVEPLFVAVPRIRQIEQVGSAFLLERGRREVANEILSRRDFANALLVPDDRHRLRMLSESIQQDFSAGDTVLADRWLVARSEALIAAAWVVEAG